MKWFWCWCLCCLSAVSYAHKASDSYLTIQATDDSSSLHIQWDIALRDIDVLLNLDSNNDRQLTWGEVVVRTPELEQLVKSSLLLQTDNKACTVYSFEPIAIDNHVDGAYAVMDFTVQCANAGVWSLQYLLLKDVDASHRGIMQWQALNQAPQTQVLMAQSAWVMLNDVNAQHSFLTFWKEGVTHIWAGYDHILFLLSLLLPVVLIRQQQTWQAITKWQTALLDAAGIVTAFTIAHSFTLVLAAFNWVYLPSRWVESAIAASVIIAAIHNIWPVWQRWRWLMAFVFGLIHGFGFASALSDLTAGVNTPLWALIGFNLGVETGQLAIVALFIPIAFMARQSPYYQRWLLTGGSCAIASVASLWLCQRLFNLSLIAG